MAGLSIIGLTLLISSFSSGRGDMNPRDNFLLFTDHSQLHQVPFGEDNTHPHLLLHDSLRYPAAVDYDPVKEKVYWIDSVKRSIYRAYINGTREESIGSFAGVSAPTGLAVDSVSRLVFFTDSGKKLIGVISLHSYQMMTLVEKGVEEPYAIVIDPHDLHIYWTDLSLKVIKRADMNGENVQTVVDTNIETPRGLAIDLQDRRLYWTDAGRNTIQYLSLSTGLRKQIYQETERNPGFYGLALSEDRVYYAASMSKAVMYLNKDGGTPTQFGSDEFKDLRDVHIYKSSLSQRRYTQRGATNCSVSNGGCVLLAICFPVPFGRSCKCPNGRRLLPDGSSCSPIPAMHGPTVIFAQNNITYNQGFVGGISGEPKEWVKKESGSVSFWRIRASNRHISAITFDYGEELLYFADTFTRTIRGVAINGSYILSYTIFDGTSNEVSGISIDWISKNLYWSDKRYDKIMMAKIEKNTKMVKTLVNSGLDRPTDIIVHPKKGYVFWLDIGERPKVERCNLQGGDRYTLLDIFANDPKSITVDFQRDMVYWSEVGLLESTIYSSDLDGNNINKVKASSDAYIQAIDIFGDLLFTSDSQNRPYIAVYSTTSDTFKRIQIPGESVSDIVVYHSGKQVQETSMCPRKGCSHLCAGTDGDEKCTCSDGHKLDVDGKTCMKTNEPLESSFIYSLGDRLCWPPTKITTEPVRDPYQYCFLKQNPNEDSDAATLIKIGVNVYSRDLFVSTSESKIRRVNLANISDVTNIVYGIDNLGGIAVDWISNNIFWTERDLGQIWVARMDGTFPTVLIRNVTRPEAIAIDPLRGKIYWSDTRATRIEVANMDGTDRKDFVTTSVQGIRDFSIDFPNRRIYWIDSELHVIESVDFDGQKRNKVVISNSQRIYGVAVYQDYLAYTDWNNRTGIYIVDKKTGREKTSIRHKDSVRAYNIMVLDKEYQPLADGPCSKDNGGCEQICLPTGNSNKKCLCQDGLMLADDGKACKSKFILEDNFFLVADDYRHQIYQASEALDKFASLKIPYSDWPMAVEYDPVEKRVYWSEWKVGLIRNMYLNGTGHRVTFEGKKGSRIDGMAIDVSNRLLYYTDRGLDAIGVVTLDGKLQATLRKAKTRTFNPRAIVLQPEAGYLYFTTTTPNSQPKITKITMDVPNDPEVNSTDVVKTGLQNPNGLCINFTTGIMYWIDGYTDRLEQMYLNGTGRKDILTLSASHAFSLACKDSTLYWTDWLKKGIFRADVTNTSNIHNVKEDYFTGLNGLKFYSSSIKQGKSVCSVNNGGCSHICLPVPGGRRCACPEGNTLNQDNITCLEGVKCKNVLMFGGQLDPSCPRLPNTTCSYSCDPGYVKRLNYDVLCEKHGSWNTSLSRLCYVDTCPFLLLPSNTRLTSTCRPTKGAVCKLDCMKGFKKTAGDGIKKCGDNLEWEGEGVTCEAVTCNGGIKDGTIDPQCNKIATSYCEFACNQGFKKKVKRIKCDANGNWIHNTSGVCESTSFVRTTTTSSTSSTPPTTTTPKYIIRTRTTVPVQTDAPGVSKVSTTTEGKTNEKPPTEGASSGDDGGSSNGGLIAGIVITVLILLVLGGLLAFFIWRRRQNQEVAYVRETSSSEVGSGKGSDMTAVGVKVTDDGSLAIVNPSYANGQRQPKQEGEPPYDDVYLAMKGEKDMIVNN